MSRFKFIHGLLILIVAALTPASRAEIVTWAFGGTVEGVFDFDSVLSDAIAPGDILSGTVSFELDTPDSNAGSDSGDYFSAITTIMGEVNGVSFQGHVPGPENSIKIRNFTDRTDTIAFRSGVNLLGLLAAFNLGYDVQPDVITTDALPALPPVFDPDLEGDFLFVSEADGTSFKVVGTLSFVVPEPATFVLLALPACALLTRRYKRRQA